MFQILDIQECERCSLGGAGECHEQTRIILDFGQAMLWEPRAGEVYPTREDGGQEDILEGPLEGPAEQSGRVGDTQALGGGRKHTVEAQRSCDRAGCLGDH